jgi:hypothetical protein
VSNPYDVWLYLRVALMLIIFYWVLYQIRGHFVARVITIMATLFFFCFVFMDQLVALLGAQQLEALMISGVLLMGCFTYWFANKYGKPPQKQ